MQLTCRYARDPSGVHLIANHLHSETKFAMSLITDLNIMKDEIAPNYYDILGLPNLHGMKQQISQHDVKTAYRRALLQHHPDKSYGANAVARPVAKYTVDQLLLAYSTLNDPTSRSSYDQSQRLVSNLLEEGKSYPGSEPVDLDDLGFNEAECAWYRNCRCGNERGFLITEQDLEDNAEFGEVIIGCRGCSLCLKVKFVMVEDG